VGVNITLIKPSTSLKVTHRSFDMIHLIFETSFLHHSEFLIRNILPSQRPSFEHAGLTCSTPLSPSITFHCFTLSSKLTFKENLIFHHSLFFSVRLISWLWAVYWIYLLICFYVLVLLLSALVILACGRLAQSRRLTIVLSKVWLQRRLIGVKSVEKGDRISPLEGYWQLLKQKGEFSGFASD